MSKLNGQTSSTFRDYANALHMIKTFTLPEAVASSAVENIHTTVGDALQARALEDDEITIEQRETNKYTDAITLGNRVLKEKGFLSTNDFIRIQKELELPQNGIRKLPGYKIADDVTGRIYYTPPEGEDRIRRMLKNFEDYFNDEDDEPDPLIRMALLHYQFEAIHPFPDGNGRTGRILMPLYLVKQGYLRLPVLFLSEYILATKSEYYRCLRGVTYEDSWDEWVVYILKGVIDQAGKTSTALDKIRRVAVAYDEKIPDSIPSFRKTDLVNFLFTNIAFNREFLATELNVSINTASTYLNILEKHKLLNVTWHQRKKIFYVSELVSILSRDK